MAKSQWTEIWNRAAKAEGYTGPEGGPGAIKYLLEGTKATPATKLEHNVNKVVDNHEKETAKSSIMMGKGRQQQTLMTTQKGLLDSAETKKKKLLG